MSESWPSVPVREWKREAFKKTQEYFANVNVSRTYCKTEKKYLKCIMFVFVFRVPFGSVWDYLPPPRIPPRKIPPKRLRRNVVLLQFFCDLSSFQVAWDLRESLKSQFAAALGLNVMLHNFKTCPLGLPNVWYNENVIHVVTFFGFWIISCNVLYLWIYV